MSRRHGYAFEAEIADGIYRLKTVHGIDLWFHKLVDTHAYDQGFVCSACGVVNQLPIIVPKVPADFVVKVDQRPTTWLEAKSTRDGSSYPIRYIEPHQVSSGIMLQSLGDHFYFVICDRSRRGHMRTRAVTAIDLDCLIYEATQAKRKSIPWEWINKRSVDIPRLTEAETGGSSTWDLKPILL